MKSKEQKRKEAIERNLPSFFDHVQTMLNCLPGGEWSSIHDNNDPDDRKDTLAYIAKVKRLAKEFNLSFSGKRDTYDSILEWSDERILVWHLSGTNLETYKKEVQINKNICLNK